jgi:hypothetical protein
VSEPLFVQENMEGRTPEAEALAKFVAKRIVSSVKTPGLEVAELSNRIGEIEEETEILGADYLKIHIIDPDWNLQRSGFVDVNEEGQFSNEAQIEFPEGSKRFWVLCAVEGSTDVTSANFRMTFQDRIFVKLREKWGTKNVPPGTQTRAQFVRDLLQEAGVPHVIPGLNIIQPVAEEKTGEAGEQQIESEQAKQQKEQQENKTPGLSSASKVKVRGLEITKAQMTVANTLMKVARGLGAPPVAVEALLFAAIAETNLGASGVSGGSHVGVLQGSASEWNSNETEEQAKYFLQGGKGFQSGGAITLAKTSTNPVEIAVKVEAPSIWPKNAYAEETEYSTFLPSAKAVYAAAGGSTSGGETAEVASDVGQLKRGTNANLDENSDECIKRLAQQVDWFGFSNGHRFFYMTGPELARQMPVAKVDIPGNHIITYKGISREGVVLTGTTYTFDQTTWEFRQTHKLKTRVQRRSKATKPASPSEVKLHLICNIGEYLSGDVILFENSGTVSGRWIIVQTTRNCFKDIYTEILCEPPVEPLPEPKESSKEEVASTGENAAPEGEEATATYQLKRALAEEKKTPGLYSYSEGSNRENKGTLFGPKPRTMDCSSTVILAYKAAGLPDPTGGNYSAPIGNTDSIIKNCEKVSTPTKDVFCFWGPSESETVHVTLYVGGGKAIAMQAPGLNLGEGEAATFGPGNFLGYYKPKNY